MSRPPSTSTPSDEADADAPGGPRVRGALAGLLGAATALVTIEMVSVFDATGVSVTEAVQNRFIDSFAASLKDVAIELFGTNDKAALQIGTALVACAIGAWLGASAVDRRWVLPAGFGVFAVLGVLSAAGDPLASLPLAIVASVLGASAGLATGRALEHWWIAGRPTATRANAEGSNASDRPDRRRVLAGGAATAAILAVTGVLARGLRSSFRQASAPEPTALATTGRRVPVPKQPFRVGTVSPYITPTEDFYRIDTALRVPVVDPESWQLKITGMVDRALTFTYADLRARELVEVPITIQCVSNEVGGDLIGTANWSGIPLVELLEEAGVQAGADQIMGESVDGFTAGFPLVAGTDGRDTLLALGMNGKTLDATHGFPARLIVPGLYGYVSATKWITEIRLTTFAAEEGFWVPRGWSALGPIKVQSRIDVPRLGDALPVGSPTLGGVAWAPHTGIQAVEVRIDDGPWQEAELGKVASVDTWVQWRYRWEPTPGPHQAEVRAITTDGEVQTAEEAPPAPDGATGHHVVRFDVR